MSYNLLYIVLTYCQRLTLSLLFHGRPELEYIWAALMIEGRLENDYSPFALGDVGVEEAEIREFQISVSLFAQFWSVTFLICSKVGLCYI